MNMYDDQDWVTPSSWILASLLSLALMLFGA